MNERHPARHSIPACDRQMLAGAYWPVIVFAVLIAARISRTPRHHLQAGLR